MAKGKKKKEDLSEDEKHPLDSSEESGSEDSVSEVAEEIPAESVVEEPKKISGSPLGKVRGKDLKNYSI